MRYLSIGHVTQDLIEGRKQFGGSALYGARAASQMGFKASVWTSTIPKDLKEESIEFFFRPNEEVTTFKHRYPEKGRRETELTLLADPIQPSEFSARREDFGIVMLAPIWDEVKPEAVEWFPNAFLGLTPQGWFRRRKEDGRVFFTSSKWERLPRKIDLIVVSEEDISGDMSAWDWIREYARVGVLTRGKKGHSVCIDGYTQDLTPPYIADEVDPTGAGDVFSTTSLLLLSSGIEPFDAVQLSSLAASFVVEQPGLDGLPSRTDLLARYQAVVAREPSLAGFRYPAQF